MKTAAVYRRVSTNSQEDNTSLEGQLSACQKYAQQHGFTIVEVFSDIESGSSLNRPAFKQLEALIERRGVDAVLVYHQDRLSRNLIDTLLLIQRFTNLNIELHSACEGEIRDGLLSAITAVIGAEERKNITRRMQKGLRDKVAKGNVTGQGGMAPFGYRYEGVKGDKHLVVAEDEAVVIRQIFAWYVDEGLSIRAITLRLTEQRVPTPRDRGRKTNIRTRQGQAVNQRGAGEWSMATVNTILKNSAYIGDMQHFKYKWRTYRNEYTGKHVAARASERPVEEQLHVSVPAIVDAALWHAAQEKRSTAKQMATRNTKYFYLLGRRITCSCGYAMSGTTTVRRDNVPVHYYKCGAGVRTAPVAARCQVPKMRADRIEADVWQWLEQELTPERLAVGIQQEQALHADRRDELTQQLATLRQDYADGEAKLRRAKDGYIGGVFSLDEFAAEKGKIELALRGIQQSIAAVQAKLDDTGLSSAEIDQLLASVEMVRQNLARATPEQRRAIIDLLDIRVVMETDDAGQRCAHVTGILALDEQLPLDIVPKNP